MDFRIADTFTHSLARLTGDEQKAVKMTAFDLQLNPEDPGLSFHRLIKTRDKNFWSMRVSSDIRLIVHKSDASLLLCYVDHHDKAYDWAERRKLETHPKTGAAQLVELRETVQEIVVPVYVQSHNVQANSALPDSRLPDSKLTDSKVSAKAALMLKPLFAHRSDDELLAYGVPAEWLADVKSVTEDTLLALCERSIFERVRSRLKARALITQPELFNAVATVMTKQKNRVFDFVVADEAQDLSVVQLRLLATLGGGRANALFFAGDLGQRIFQQPFSWKALGVDIRGRSRTLRINYRTSHQLRMQADRLLGTTVVYVDGNSENWGDTVSVFNGPPPTISSFRSESEEIEAVGSWIRERAKTGILPHEFGIFVRSAAQLDRAQAAVTAAGMLFTILDQHIDIASGQVSLSTMHLAKGLEFRAVVVMACDDEVIPLQERIETVGDDADLQEVYDTERYLLYVACTRARDHLLVTSVEPASEFLDDMRV